MVAAIWAFLSQPFASLFSSYFLLFPITIPPLLQLITGWTDDIWPCLCQSPSRWLNLKRKGGLAAPEPLRFIWGWPECKRANLLSKFDLYICLHGFVKYKTCNSTLICYCTYQTHEKRQVHRILRNYSVLGKAVWELHLLYLWWCTWKTSHACPGWHTRSSS